MDFSIASILFLDGATNGAVYALMGLALVLVFAVTRVIFIPQGEFVAYGALTLAMLQLGRMPGTVWLLLAMAAFAALLDIVEGVRARRGALALAADVLRTIALPCIVAALTWWAVPRQLNLVLQSLLTLAIVTPMGPLVYRLAFRSLADASVLVLLIVAVGVHFALTGLGLVMFGAEGFRNPSFWDAHFQAGALTLSGQTVIIFLASIALILGLKLFFDHTLHGKALRDGGEPARRAADGHLVGERRQPELRARRLHRRAVGALDRADDDARLRLGLPDRPEGFRRGDLRRPRELPGDRDRRALRRPDRVVQLVLGERFQGSDRLHADPAGAAVAVVPARPRRRGGVAMTAAAPRPVAVPAGAQTRGAARALRSPIRCG